MPACERSLRPSRTASRPEAQACQPRGDERRAAPGGLAAARPCRCRHDAALRPPWGPRDRAGRRERGASGRGSDGASVTGRLLQHAILDGRPSGGQVPELELIGTLGDLCAYY